VGRLSVIFNFPQKNRLIETSVIAIITNLVRAPTLSFENEPVPLNGCIPEKQAGKVEWKEVIQEVGDVDCR